MNVQTTYRRWGSTFLGIAVLLATLASSAPTGWQNAQAPTDVSLRAVADRSTVRTGQKVTITATMTNLGPGDATFVDVAFGMPDGMRIVSVTCDQGVSPDGPFCEYQSVPAGRTVITTLVAVPRPGFAIRSRVLSVAASALFENPDAVDPNAANNMAAVKIKLIGRLSQP